jgi:hypothetical protein
LNGSANLLNHHCWRAVLWGSAFLLFFLNSCIIQAQQPSRLSDRGDEITFFYKDPKAERLVGVFTSLRDQSLPWNAYPPVAGLFARIFILHPDWLERLVPGAPDAKAASTLVAAAQLSGQPAKAKLLRARFASSGLDDRLEAEFAGLPTRLEDLRIKTPTHLDIFWGASFADGDGRHVRPIIDFFADTSNTSELVAIDIAKLVISMTGGLKDILAGLKDKYGEEHARQMIYAATALWAIQSNSRQHEYVEQTTAKYIGDHPGTPATKALSALTGIK